MPGTTTPYAVSRSPSHGWVAAKRPITPARRLERTTCYGSCGMFNSAPPEEGLFKHSSCAAFVTNWRNLSLILEATKCKLVYLKQLPIRSVTFSERETFRVDFSSVDG